MAGDNDDMFMTRSLNVTPKKTSDKYEASFLRHSVHHNSKFTL